MSEQRDNFVLTFSEGQAAAIEAAAAEHMNCLHDEPGSDPFRWGFTPDGREPEDSGREQ